MKVPNQDKHKEMTKKLVKKIKKRIKGEIVVSVDVTQLYLFPKERFSSIDEILPIFSNMNAYHPARVHYQIGMSDYVKKFKVLKK